MQVIRIPSIIPKTDNNNFFLSNLIKYRKMTDQ
jgi:hypothetical protein